MFKTNLKLWSKMMSNKKVQKQQIVNKLDYSVTADQQIDNLDNCEHVDDGDTF